LLNIFDWCARQYKMAHRARIGYRHVNSYSNATGG
jgi:hypothetical protein